MNAILFLALAATQSGGPLAGPSSTVNLGTVRGGPMIATTVRVTNRGDAALTIIGSRTTCGCVVSKPPAGPIAAGASADVAVEIATLTQPDGLNRWTIGLRYQMAGEAQVREWDHRIEATLVREVGLSPAAVTLIGSGASLAHEVTLTDRRPSPLVLKLIHASSPRIRAGVARDWTKTGAGWELTVRVGIGECPPGRHDEFVTLYTDDPDYREIKIPVNVTKKSAQRVTATPTEVRFLADSKPNNALVLLRDRDGQAVEIERADSDNSAIRCRWAEGAYPAAAMRVLVTPGATPPISATIRVQIRAPEPATVLVPVTFKGEQK
jgi:hypothetical protein